MTYQKPEILQFGAAIRAIQATLDKPSGTNDAQFPDLQTDDPYGSDE